MGLVLLRVARPAFAGLAIAGLAIAAAIRVTGSLVDFFSYQDVR